MATFQELMQRVLDGDPGVDFTDLREAFTATGAYAPLGGPADALEVAMRREMEIGNFEEAIRVGIEVLRHNPLSIRVHCYLWNLLRETGRDEQGAFHAWFGKRLMESIDSSGDGRTMETAIVVISVEEEHNFLHFKGLRPRGSFQLIEGDGGRMYDLVKVSGESSDESHDLYFDVSCSFEFGQDFFSVSRGKSK